MTFTVGLLGLTLAIVIPFSWYVSAIGGSILAWMLAISVFIISWKLSSQQRTSNSLLHALDFYLFICFAISLVWFSIWILDGSEQRNQHVNIPVEPDASPYFVYLVIAYNVVASFSFIGPVRIFPVSLPAYIVTFAALIVGIWRFFVVLVMVVRSTTTTTSSSEQADRMEEGVIIPAETAMESAFSPKAATTTTCVTAYRSPVPSLPQIPVRYHHQQQQQQQQSPPTPPLLASSLALKHLHELNKSVNRTPLANLTLQTTTNVQKPKDA